MNHSFKWGKLAVWKKLSEGNRELYVLHSHTKAQSRGFSRCGCVEWTGHKQNRNLAALWKIPHMCAKSKEETHKSVQSVFIFSWCWVAYTISCGNFFARTVETKKNSLWTNKSFVNLVRTGWLASNKSFRISSVCTKKFHARASFHPRTSGNKSITHWCRSPNTLSSPKYWSSMFTRLGENVHNSAQICQLLCFPGCQREAAIWWCGSSLHRFFSRCHISGGGKGVKSENSGVFTENRHRVLFSPNAIAFHARSRIIIDSCIKSTCPGLQSAISPFQLLFRLSYKHFHFTERRFHLSAFLLRPMKPAKRKKNKICALRGEESHCVGGWYEGRNREGLCKCLMNIGVYGLWE